MSKQLSFSPLANQYMKNFREMINNSEDKVDVTNSFALISCRFLQEVFPENADNIKDNDVTFQPSEQEFYKISQDLFNEDYFQKIWQCSDLPSIIENFANSAYHRYTHITKHPQKSQMKIRV